MISTSNKIFIHSPCDENWDAMSKTDIGKLCLKCDKEVVDFTSFSEYDFLEYFKNPSNHGGCGRFYNTQIQNTIIHIDLNRKYPKWKVFLIAFLICFGQQLYNIEVVYSQQSLIDTTYISPVEIDGTQKIEKDSTNISIDSEMSVSLVEKDSLQLKVSVEDTLISLSELNEIILINSIIVMGDFRLAPPKKNFLDSLLEAQLEIKQIVDFTKEDTTSDILIIDDLALNTNSEDNSPEKDKKETNQMPYDILLTEETIFRKRD